MSSDDELDKDLIPEEVTRLNSLIRRSRGGDSRSAPLDDKLVTAYIRGRATPDEVETVQQALEKSADLCEDFLYEAGLYRADIQSRFDDAPWPPEGEAADDRPETDRLQGLEPGEILHPPAWKNWFRKPLVWGGLLPVGLAVLVLVLLWPRAPEVHWVEQAQLSREQFERDPLRGGEEEFPEPADSEEAAILAMLQAVEWSDGQFRVGASQPSLPPGRGVRIEFEGVPKAYATVVPDDAQLLDLWFLATPSLKRYRIGMPADNLRTPWPETTVKEGVLTLTYRTAAGIEASLPVLISLP